MIDLTSPVAAVFVSCIAAVVISQFTSFSIRAVKRKEISWFDLINTGGFPSSHSALVSALSTGIFLIDGFSVTFLIAFFFGLIVVRDAIGLRREVGFLSAAMNLLQKHRKFNEYTGHSLIQVIAGVLLGIVVTVIII